jgi:hypothetical protein
MYFSWMSSAAFELASTVTGTSVVAADLNRRIIDTNVLIDKLTNLNRFTVATANELGIKA